MKKLEILHADDQIVLINKASGMLSIPDRYAPEKPNLLTLLKKKYGDIYTVHRLDKETSGILCYARTETAHKHLSKQFQERTVDKIYLTLVDGQMHQEEGVIDKPIAPHPHISGKMIVTQKGKVSRTDWKVVETFKNFTLVEANIKTGRTHQIRVHFEALGYPLAIDSTYGRREAFLLSEVKSKKKYRLGKDQEERPLMSRSILHAYRLTIEHPTTGEAITTEAPLPKDFRAVVQQLRKWNAIQ